MVKIEDTVTGKKYGLYELGAVTCPDEKSSEKEEIFTFSQLQGCFVLDTFVEIKDSKDGEIYNGEIADMSEIVFNAIKGLDVLQIEPHPDFEGLLIIVMK